MRRSHYTRAAMACSLLLAGATACGLLDTQQPNIVDAISTFALAKDGDFNPVAIPGSEDTFNDNSDGHVLTSGILADEFVNPGFIPSRSEIDARIAQPTTAGL